MSLTNSRPAVPRPDKVASDRLPFFLTGFLLAGLVCFSYLGVLSQKLIMLDDAAYLGTNRSLDGGLNWRNIGWAFTTTHEVNYHPMTWVSFLADVRVYGMSPYPDNIKAWGFKLTNLILHTCNTLLVYGLFCRMTNRVGPSAMVAALFGIHPIHVESVAWATERKDVLSTFFVLLAMRAYVDHTRLGGTIRFTMTHIWFVMSLLSKQMYVTLPIVLLLLDFWPLGRMSVGKREIMVDRNDAVTWRRAVAEKTGLLLLSLGFSALIYSIQAANPRVLGVHSTWLTRVPTALSAYWVYLRKMSWPSDLSFFYPYPTVPPNIVETLAFAVAIAGISVFVFVYRHRAPFLFCGWFWYLVTLLPVVGLVQVGWQAYADRYSYFPLIGPFVALAFSMDALVRRVPTLDKIAGGAQVAVVLGCVYLTMAQVSTWRDSETVSRHALGIDPCNHVALLQLGMTAASRSDWDEAVSLIRKSRDVRPDYYPTRLNLAMIEAAMGNVREAKIENEAIIGLVGDEYDACYQLGAIHLGVGEPFLGAEWLRRSLIRQPSSVSAMYLLGHASIQLGDLAGARGQFDQILSKWASESERVRNDTSLALDYLNRIEGGVPGALDAYNKRFHFPPTLSGSMLRMKAGIRLADQGLALKASGDIVEGNALIERSLNELRRAVEMWPENVEAIYNMGKLARYRSRHREADDAFRRVLTLDPMHQRAKQALAK